MSKVSKVIAKIKITEKNINISLLKKAVERKTFR